MKRLVVIAMALTLCAMLAGAQTPKISKKDFIINTEKLNTFLKLDADQLYKVGMINKHFKKQQAKVRKAKAPLQEQKKQEAVYANLKLMREVLTDTQYRKYVAALNMTNNHYLALEKSAYYNLHYMADIE